MNIIGRELIQKANEEAIYNLYLYLLHKMTPQEHETLQSAIRRLDSIMKNNEWNIREIKRLEILKNAVYLNPDLAKSEISNLALSKSGLTACTFTKSDGRVSIVFKGTGGGEWIDNGEGLSGIPEENTYITYSKDGKVLYSKTIQKDYATDQQVEALNWFSEITAKNNWKTDTEITVSGHSKGGNKAQFITIHSDLVNNCYSFDGQGFSPEALNSLKKQYDTKFEERRHRIFSISSYNDYINVLGNRLVPESHIYYFKTYSGIHYPESLLDKNGEFLPQCEQGRISAYAENISKELMSLPPLFRQYATLGIMNIFQKYLGEGTPVNEDSVSLEKTLAGIGIAAGTLLHQLYKSIDN